MSNPENAFTGSTPKLYNEYLVSLLFKPYAMDLVNRLRFRSPSRVLEVAAGTDVVTRAWASELSEIISIVATDLNPAMLDQAMAIGTSRPTASNGSNQPDSEQSNSLLLLV